MLDCVKYGYEFTGPVIYEYVLWILDEAVKRGFDKLYFLARDGYVLKLIAEEICKNRKLNIEGRYLYCSRFSLRMPTYSFIGEEAYELLFLWSSNISVYSLLQRLKFTDYEMEEFCKELEIHNIREILSLNEYNNIIAKIRKNVYYKRIMLKKSEGAYENTIAYFKQEGLFDDNKVVIVDSGWSGSMQRSLRQLMERNNYKGKIFGMYFGMYNAPKDEKDGEYLTYYFDAFHYTKHKVFFENKFFECILSAPHGMTEAYEFKDDKYLPVLKENLNTGKSYQNIELQTQGMLKYAKEEARINHIFDKKTSLKKSYRILKRIMSEPTEEEVNAFGEFAFCDDVSDGYGMKVVEKGNMDKLKNSMFIYRILNKILYKGERRLYESVWAYGALAYIPQPKKLWYKLNVYLYEYIKIKNFSRREKRRILKNG